MDINLHFYSERGLINDLIIWLKYGEGNKEKFFDILGADFNESSIVDIYDEFSFGEFGSPDLIIKIKNGVNTDVYLIEAKVDSFEKCATKIANRFVFKDNASMINIQLLLRSRFIANLYKDKENANEIMDNFESIEWLKEYEDSYAFERNYKGRGRKLAKKELVKWAYNNLKGEKYTYHYVALVNDNKTNKEIQQLYKDYFYIYIDGNEKPILDNFKFITWKQIDAAIGEEKLKETWETTDKNY